MTPREKMVWEIKKVYELDAPLVFSAMLKVPREEFVSKRYKNIAYDDSPVPIGFGQTMSQPYTVAFMTHLLVTSDKLQVTSNGKLNRVLEVGTGSGYQAAVLSHLAKEVYTIEIVPELARRARTVLALLGYKNVHIKTGSGEWGWQEKAPFDAILVTAAIESKVPKTLFEQLKEEGVLVAPIGRGPDKIMTRITKLKGVKGKNLTNPTSLKLRGAWEEFGIFHFVPFVEEPN